MTLEKIAAFVAKNWGLTGEIEVIYSELDAVYKLSSIRGNYTVKCSAPGKDFRLIDMEYKAISHLKQKSNFSFNLQNPLFSNSGNHFETLDDQIIRVYTWIELPLQAEVTPLVSHSFKSIGRLAGSLSTALSDFDHTAAHRFIKWNPSEVAWIIPHLTLVPPFWYPIFNHWISTLQELHATLQATLRKQICYNDLNDYNVLMSWNEELAVYESAALLDMGDMVYTHTVNELAMACAYTCLKVQDPLKTAMEVIQSYHAWNPLHESEIKCLYYHIAARLMISLTVSAINRSEHPENDYLQVTDFDAWSLLGKWKDIHPEFAEYCFRSVCGYEPCVTNTLFTSWSTHQNFYPILPRLHDSNYSTLDLSTGSYELANVPDFENTETWIKNIEALKEKNNSDYQIGRYNEVRPIYTSDDFKMDTDEGPAWRTLHIGIDLFSKVNTPIHLPYDGTVVHAFDNAGNKNYGPTLIIRHTTELFDFYTLYGHLSSGSLLLHKTGKEIKAGEIIGQIGDQSVNGNWPPHLHFQVILNKFDLENDFPGVCEYRLRNVYTSICPDPNLILKLCIPEKKTFSIDDLLKRRKSSLGKNLSISYKNPLFIERAYRQYLYDHTGRRFLDTVNNVAHIGHQHPEVIKAQQKQINLLNTNTRYLYPQLMEFAEKLKSFLHPSLNTVYVVNSGSEANELAVRMAKANRYTENMLVYQHGYHGNTQSLVHLSSYKFDRKGGKGAPPTTHVLPMPDVFRGKHGHDESSYLSEALSIIDHLEQNNQLPAAFLAEYILSCGGQVVSPKSYFHTLIDYIKSKGILYIADEVQTGLGRTGKFCSYEYADVLPDIVTFGKPLGNGHPMGAVVCNEGVADGFNNGMEYFNTFGGNAVSCLIGTTVLNCIENEQIMDHALHMENYFKQQLESLSHKHPLISDVRGHGLFLGFECSLENKMPATKQAKYIANRMKDLGILMSTDGPDDNVLKIKPPMVFTTRDVDEVIRSLGIILKDDFLRI